MTIPVIDSILQKKDFQLRLAGEQGKLRNFAGKKNRNAHSPEFIKPKQR